MKLNVRAFALAIGNAAAALFSICAFFVAIAPDATAEFIGYLLHINLTGLSRPISWGSYFVGVLGVSIWAGVVAAIYNISLRR